MWLAADLMHWSDLTCSGPDRRCTLNSLPPGYITGVTAHSAMAVRGYLRRRAVKQSTLGRYYSLKAFAWRSAPLRGFRRERTS